MMKRTSDKLFRAAMSNFRLNRLTLFITLFCITTGLTAQDTSAAGTAAGSIISNYASISYSMQGSNYSRNSNISTLMVDDKVSFTLNAADAANVTITSGGKTYMTYMLTNTGNAPHDFTLNATVAGTPAFTPHAGPVFYVDTAGTTPLPIDPNAGNLPYITSLAPDSTRTVYMFITAPEQLTDGQTIDYLITAEAYQPANLGVTNPPVKSSAQTALDAAATKNANLMKRFVVLADAHGNGNDANRDGKYAVIAKDGNNNTIGFKARAATVNIVKTATVTDRLGGSQPTSGATIHYVLAVSATGSGTVMGVVITDPIPANTIYAAGTLKLNGTLLSDKAGDDAGDTGETTAGTVTIKLGEMTSDSPVQVITFDVKID